MWPHAYISAEQGIYRKCTAFALIIRSQHNEHILDSDHQGNTPDDEGEGPEEIVVAWLGSKGGGENIEGRSANVAIDDPYGLIRQPKCQDTPKSEYKWIFPTSKIE